jgi:hypothetical protein
MSQLSMLLSCCVVSLFGEKTHQIPPLFGTVEPLRTVPLQVNVTGAGEIEIALFFNCLGLLVWAERCS